MKCHCQSKAVIELQHAALCKSHFIRYFEEKVFKTINKHRLIDRDEKLCIATSGGKDSLTVLYLTKKYLKKYKMDNELVALAVDEGIEGYRAKTLEDLKKFCEEQEVKLNIVSFEKGLGKSLDEAYPIINKGTSKKPCNVCGVWRRYLLNKYARDLGATKVVTGHNLDDEAQAIVMNMFKANTKLAGRLGPISGVQEHKLFTQRVKPLYFCNEKEVRLYTLLKGWQVEFTECPYAHSGYRHEIQSMLNDFEEKYSGTKQGIVNSFLALLPLLKEEKGEIGKCKECGEAANKGVCNACKMKEMVNNAV
jgi:tRNA-5-methyluridine54 2-sulfurtransferase